MHSLFWQRVAFTGASWRPVAVQHQQLCRRDATKAVLQLLLRARKPRLM